MKSTLNKHSLFTVIKEYIENIGLSNELNIEKNNTDAPQGRHNTPLIIRKGKDVLAIIEFSKGAVDHEIDRVKEDIAYISQLLDAPISILWLPDKFYLYLSETKEWVPHTTKSNFNNLIDTLFQHIQLISKKNVSWENVQKEWLLRLEEFDFDTKTLLGDFIKNSNISLIVKKDYFTLPEKDENTLFMTLIGSYLGRQLCRFTSLRALFCTINYKKQRMNGLVSMNDKTEVDYVAKYIGKKEKELKVLFNTDNINNYYILSCCASNRENDFTMLRLYADDAKGACIKYSILDDYKSQNFYIGPISYANRNGVNPKLDFISEILKTKIGGKSIRFKNLGIWQHFFKPYEYKDEKEIRLLFYNIKQNNKTTSTIVSPNWDLNETYGIVFSHIEFEIEKTNNKFPLVISSITLGPKTPEADLNADQLNYLLENNINVLRTNNKKIVQTSKIKHYR